jgi:cell wall-associated NlpC family hydrolase
MRRGLIFLAIFSALVAVPVGQAASWARPQIRTVVDAGLMGPSVQNFRPGQPLTRGAIGYAIAVLTGEQQVVVDPQHPLTIAQLDRRLVGYLGLRSAANTFRRTARDAGLDPPYRFGDEVVARSLQLRVNHPAERDDLELRPNDVATRAEAAYSLARILRLGQWDKDWVNSLAGSFTLPAYTSWQTRVLKRSVHFTGFPYVWGGTSEHEQTLFGVTDRGGFDCSGFVWRVYKLVPYDGGGTLSSVIKGRTTYQMSGEVPKSKRIAKRYLKPGDVMFFGSRGPSSSPSQVDHTGIYLGRGWMIHSSGQGVTVIPFAGWYVDRFAWARRPLREAGLA